MLQMRQSQRQQRDLQTTAKIRYQLNQQFYNIQTHNNDTAKRSALVMALFVYVMRLENKELEDSIYTRLNLSEFQLQQLASYRMRILAADGEHEVVQIQNEMVEKIEPLFKLDEANLLNLDPTVPTPMLSPLSPNLAKQKIYCTKYYIDMSVGQFHKNINNFIVVLNNNAQNEYYQGNTGNAVALKQHANDLYQAGGNVIHGQAEGDVEQINDNMEDIIQIERMVDIVYDLLNGAEGVQMLSKKLLNRASGMQNGGSAGMYGNTGNGFKNDDINNDDPIIDQSSNVNYGNYGGGY
ncbi:MAG: hypothetical protein GY782_07980 [Gammaproteobacteria bacterium]|nr:hypothetical protein [Gammaproteobacteria bacterium]